jgi:hypothetical protein
MGSKVKKMSSYFQLTTKREFIFYMHTAYLIKSFFGVTQKQMNLDNRNVYQVWILEMFIYTY